MKTTISAVSKYGFKDENKWYNWAKGTEPVSLNRGDSVELTLNEKGYVTSVVKSSSTSAAQPQQPNGNNQAPSKKDGDIARATAAKAVMGSPLLASMAGKSDWSEVVANLAKPLMFELEQYILTGKFPEDKK